MGYFKVHKLSNILIFVFFVFCLFLHVSMDISVLTHSQNEGVYFVAGQGLINSHSMLPGRGIFFTPIYSLLIQICGFNTYALIASHLLQTFIVCFIACLIFLILQKIIPDNFFPLFGVFIWLYLVTVPFGDYLLFEIQAHKAFEAELLCVLFSLMSIFFITLAPSQFSYLFTGIISVIPLMAKANGIFFLFSLIVWFVLCIFKSKEKKSQVKFFSWFILGVSISLIALHVVLLIVTHDLIAYWRDNFSAGYYKFTNDVQADFNLFSKIFRRQFSSKDIFIGTFFCTYSLYGLRKSVQLWEGKSLFWDLWLLFGIWGLGSLVAIIIPGKYEPYYYHLAWVPLAFAISFSWYRIANWLKRTGKVSMVYILNCVIILVLLSRLIICSNTYSIILNSAYKNSIFNQPESFQNYVTKSNEPNHYRDSELTFADGINSLLPLNNDTVYVFNFPSPGFSAFTPNIYIYAKRYPPTYVLPEHLMYRHLLPRYIKKLKSDLEKNPPALFVLTNKPYFQSWQVADINPFLKWLLEFLNEKYKPVITFKSIHEEEKKVEEFLIYRRNYF